MACEAKDVPPRFAKMGALRWMRANVVMNGAEPCAMRVRTGWVAIASRRRKDLS